MLVPAERNARTHSQEQIKQLVASIQAFGWTNPILIDEDHAIIAGHGRLEAARLAGLSDVPTITLTGLSAAQKRALAIADNKLALNAGWDEPFGKVGGGKPHPFAGNKMGRVHGPARNAIIQPGIYAPVIGDDTTNTAIAAYHILAEMTGRVCHAIEISPTYCDTAIIRWQNFTGQTATLEGDGRTFADIETERRLVDAA